MKPLDPAQQFDAQPTELKVEQPSKRNRARFWPRGLSGKLLVLTSLFIMLAEILVFIPSIANYRLTWLAQHFNTGEAASLTLERLEDEAISNDIREQLFALTKTEMIVVRRDGVSKILVNSEMPNSVDRHVELVAPGRVQAAQTIIDAFDTLILGGDRTIRVFGPMRQRSGTLELVMKERPLRDAMITYAGNVLIISLLISLVTALLVFMTLRWLLIKPMQRITRSMLTFATDPEDPSLVIEPSERDDEIGVAEEQLSEMQRQLSGTLIQQRHLADLGLAVSKINHDLRNILASASLFSDRLSSASDPAVRRLAPRLIRTIDRAADYTRSVLAYGRAGEAVPNLTVLRLHRLCEDVAETLALDTDGDVEWVNDVDADVEIKADSEQMFRVLLNLSRNALQAMEHMDPAVEVKRLTIQARKQKTSVAIRVCDTGPGIPAAVRETLFAPFKTSGRSGGTGLGLVIAAELVKAHGGTVELINNDGPGAEFEITLP